MKKMPKTIGSGLLGGLAGTIAGSAWAQQAADPMMFFVTSGGTGKGPNLGGVQAPTPSASALSPRLVPAA